MSAVGSAVAGSGQLVEVGAVSEASPLRYYQVSGRNCTPVASP